MSTYIDTILLPYGGDGITGKINYRSQSRIETINELSEPQKNRVCELGWGKFLEMAIDFGTTVVHTPTMDGVDQLT